MNIKLMIFKIFNIMTVYADTGSKGGISISGDTVTVTAPSAGSPTAADEVQNVYSNLA